MTFTLVARCARTGQLGLAVSSSSPAVAARCAHARAGIGAVASQNVTDPRLGHRALRLLAEGASAAEIEGGETWVRSAAAAMLPASPTATKYSSWRSVKRRGIGHSSPGTP